MHLIFPADNVHVILLDFTEGEVIAALFRPFLCALTAAYHILLIQQLSLKQLCHRMNFLLRDIFI